MTGIISTIGPGTFESDSIVKAALMGTNVFRVNLGKKDRDNELIFYNYQMAKNKLRKYNRSIQLLVDLPTSRPRVDGIINQEKLSLHSNVIISDRKNDKDETTIISNNFSNCLDDISVDDIICIDNGKVKIKVLSINCKKKQIEGECIYCLGNLNISDSFSFPNNIKYKTLTNYEIEMLKLLKKEKIFVDYFALSFVNNDEDINFLKDSIREYDFSNTKILSKIETSEGVQNIDAIIDLSDGIIIARGDLGLNIKIEELFNIENKLILKSKQYNKICVIATQMLEKYAISGELAYSEIIDICFSLNQFVDFLMLSGESAGILRPFKSISILEHLISTKLENKNGNRVWFM